MQRLLLILSLLCCAWLAQAQAVPPPQRWDLFLLRDSSDADRPTLGFVNLLSGEVTEVAVQGSQFGVTTLGVIYLDSDDRTVKLAEADGTIRNHPFIALAPGDHSIDWIIAADGARIAWTVARQLADESLATTTWLANSDGNQLRELLADRPRAGIRLRPVAFRPQSEQLIMEAHASEGIEASPYRLRAGLFALDFAADEVSSRALPGEQDCYCAFGIGADAMLRLRQASAGGFAVEVFALESSQARLIEALPLADYPYAGNLIVSADGSLAVYALSQTAGDTGARTVLARIDLIAARQEIISRPIPALIRPLAFSEDNSALLFTTASEGGTWKLRLADGTINKVADGVYLGRMTDR
ncbi:MAG: hypothetical protein OXE95_06080 [Chloroflexi bacterium]|nr:hypothetical protein [Chloroflexota bacterium]MCY4247131.1 hypothetical protein [Chloroflexota bacterium]